MYNLERNSKQGRRDPAADLEVKALQEVERERLRCSVRVAMLVVSV